MTAQFKSHVLRRDEKGFLGVPFKRMLLGGVCGGLSYLLASLAFGGAGIPIGVLVGMSAVVLTGSRGGLPLWRRLYYWGRGLLLLAAVRRPDGPSARLCRWLDLPTDLARLDAAAVFAPPASEFAVDLREWVTFAYAREDDGLVFVDAPLGGEDGL